MQNLHWLLLPKTEDGWYLPHKHRLFFDPDSDVFRSLSGVRINLKTGGIKLVCQPANPRETHTFLFNHVDIEEVFSYRIGSTFFSLDPIDSSLRPLHPCQTMRFDKDIPHQTEFVKTMFFTDYLLKFFTTGTEISSFFPFDTRSTCGLLERLPLHLRKVLQPLHDSEQIDQKAHRFWIESEQIPYKLVEHGADGDEIHFYFGDVKMKVKKHLLVKDKNGNLIDSPDDDSDNTPEAVFAREFTKHYDEIGLYFPEFLRLRELVKLATAQVIVSSIIESNKKKYNIILYYIINYFCYNSNIEF